MTWPSLCSQLKAQLVHSMEGPASTHFKQVEPFKQRLDLCLCFLLFNKNKSRAATSKCSLADLHAAVKLVTTGGPLILSDQHYRHYPEPICNSL